MKGPDTDVTLLSERARDMLTGCMDMPLPRGRVAGTCGANCIFGKTLLADCLHCTRYSVHAAPVHMLIEKGPNVRDARCAPLVHWADERRKSEKDASRAWRSAKHVEIDPPPAGCRERV